MHTAIRQNQYLFIPSLIFTLNIKCFFILNHSHNFVIVVVVQMYKDSYLGSLNEVGVCLNMLSIRN